MRAKEFDPLLDKDEAFFFLTNVDTNHDDTSRAAAAKQYLIIFPSGPNIAEATFVVAESLETSDRNQAKTYYTQIAAKFPGTEWSRQANERLTNRINGCGLGKTWSVVESGNASPTWTRRGTSNIFDVSGLAGGSQFTAEQSIEINGDGVRINRYSASDNNLCKFTGKQTALNTYAGTYSCTLFQPSSGWSANVICN